MSNEEWKGLPEYEEYYEVSNLGRVRSLRSGKIVRPSVSKTGYTRLCISVNGVSKSFSLHRVVAQLFVGELMEHVDHIDGNPRNNAASNLRPCTRRENQLYHTKNKYPGAYWDKHSKNWKASVGIGGKNKFLGNYNSKKEASEAYLKYVREVLGEEIRV